MGFILAKLVWAVLSPSSFMVLLAAAGVALGWLGRRRLGRALQLAGIGLLLAALLLPLERWAIQPLEERFPHPAFPARVDGIIVLGGAGCSMSKLNTALSQVVREAAS